MPRPNRAPRPPSDCDGVPFPSAEAAWFWFIRCQKARNDGARFRSDAGGIARPCEPDDLYRMVMELHRARRLRRVHLRVLEAYGLREAAPDPRAEEERGDGRLWDEALDRLAAILKSKGVVQ